MRRAAHQFLDEPRVFEDRLAMARSRFAEDELASAIGRGATQYVVLGAGLGTYAYRAGGVRPGLRVFEVDHLSTQEWKQMRMAEAGIAVPERLRLVPIDFEKETLRGALAGAGFDESRISFFSWLGVTPYLTAEAAMATLSFIGSLPEGSGVVFDYAVERSSLDPVGQMALDALASRIARAGEPFRLLLDPAALQGLLRSAGFHELEDLGVQVGLAHLMSARV